MHNNIQNSNNIMTIKTFFFFIFYNTSCHKSDLKFIRVICRTTEFYIYFCSQLQKQNLNIDAYTVCIR